MGDRGRTDAAAHELAAFRERHPEIVAVDAIFADLCCIFRGKRCPIDEAAKLYDPGLAIAGSSVLLDVDGECYDPGGYGFSDGDPDCLARVVPGTLRPVPWADRPLAQALLCLYDADGGPYPFDPRNVLRRVVGRFDELGLRPVVAFELEFYLIDRRLGPDRAPQPPISPLTGERDRATQVYGINEVDAYAGYLQEVADSCAAQAIPAGTASAEYAPGQFEINLRHVTDPLAAADHAVLFRRAAQAVARRHDLRATFMAKPYASAAGNGMHLHVSLLDRDGRNPFDDGGPQGSDRLRHAIGGVLATLPEAMAIYAPNVNSYRRFRPNLFVPTAACWGYENRSTAIRVPLGGGADRRLEFRLPGTDANPYLTLAAALAGMHHGLVETLDPGPAATGNAATALDPRLPFRLRDALAALAEAAVLPGYLGAEYCRVYHLCKTSEFDRFAAAISPREYEWYLLAD
jgi:glutamine synthetase